jgi:hypothetical protein
MFSPNYGLARLKPSASRSLWHSLFRAAFTPK